MRIAVIGAGLVGGSVALAARERADVETVAWDPDTAALREAEKRGAVTATAHSLEQAVDGAHVVFIAAPVGKLPELVAQVLASAPQDCVITDVGSTKRSVVAAGGADQRFVGGHPLAGAETSGIEHARADLFDGAVWYLTPTEITDGQLYERLHRLITAFGAQPTAIDAETHDQLLALVSHLPHVLANVLVSQTAVALAAQGERLPATGPSFRDATRVAGSNTAIWADIYLSNRDALMAAIDDTIARLSEVRVALQIADSDAVATWNYTAAADRRRLLEGQLSGGELNELRVAVTNKPGVVAQLALELGRAGVNISDMVIHPAADMASGVVTFWIAGDAAATRAEEIIASMGFPVFRT